MTGSGLTVTTKNFASAQKEFLDRIHAAAVARKIGIGGRKMAVDKENSKISGATHSSRKCYDLERKEDLDVKCIVGDKSNILKKFKLAGFVASSADYHLPRHHPPKNN
ncbi:uncharacterized protein LOC132299891 isoform X1 [Cornus florida]|uniref:uncharacterized protein LOC132299891 isoform X1 n=1 Tax=Cornus florida TaxID=4283 RepID=UPI00289E8FA1|nr:uncharacterized protein LOC132299891 isoform X1 [Cornus florida]